MRRDTETRSDRFTGRISRSATLRQGRRSYRFDASADGSASMCGRPIAGGVSGEPRPSQAAFRQRPAGYGRCARVASAPPTQLASASARSRAVFAPGPDLQRRSVKGRVAPQRRSSPRREKELRASRVAAPPTIEGEGRSRKGSTIFGELAGRQVADSLIQDRWMDF